MERALSFMYRDLQKAQVLDKLLADENIPHIMYKGDNYYPTEFTIRKCDRSWNEIMKIVNSIYAPRYRYKKTNFGIYDGVLKEVVIGTI